MHVMLIFFVLPNFLIPWINDSLRTSHDLWLSHHITTERPVAFNILYIAIPCSISKFICLCTRTISMGSNIHAFLPLFLNSLQQCFLYANRSARISLCCANISWKVTDAVSVDFPSITVKKILRPRPSEMVAVSYSLLQLMTLLFWCYQLGFISTYPPQEDLSFGNYDIFCFVYILE